MTVEELEKYRDMPAELAALQTEIKNLQDTYKSPAFSGIGVHSNVPSNPTEQAAFKIIAKKNEYAQKCNDLMNKMNTIDVWLNSINDQRIRVIVSYRYKQGLSWEEVNKKVYGTYQMYKYNARKYFMRYMGREK